MSFEDLRSEVLKLTPEFRAKLAKELIFSLDRLSDAEVENMWIEEAIRRDDEIDQGNAALRPANEVFSRAKARFK